MQSHFLVRGKISNKNIFLNTYRTLPIWIIVWNIHSELEDTILVQAMSDEYDTKPH